MAILIAASTLVTIYESISGDHSPPETTRKHRRRTTSGRTEHAFVQHFLLVPVPNPVVLTISFTLHRPYSPKISVSKLAPTTVTSIDGSSLPSSPSTTSSPSPQHRFPFPAASSPSSASAAASTSSSTSSLSPTSTRGHGVRSISTIGSVPSTTTTSRRNSDASIRSKRSTSSHSNRAFVPGNVGHAPPLLSSRTDFPELGTAGATNVTLDGRSRKTPSSPSPSTSRKSSLNMTSTATIPVDSSSSSPRTISTSSSTHDIATPATPLTSTAPSANPTPTPSPSKVKKKRSFLLPSFGRKKEETTPTTGISDRLKATLSSKK